MTPCCWKACAPAACSSRADRSSEPRCTGLNSKEPCKPTPPSHVASASSVFPLTFGLDTFGDVTHDESDRPLSHAQTIRNVVEQGVLADEVRIDFFGIGEHHTDLFPVSAGDVVLAAIAARTTRIHLGS